MIVTRALPGNRWLQVLIEPGCRVEIYSATAPLLGRGDPLDVGSRCRGGIGQTTERWGEIFLPP